MKNKKRLFLIWVISILVTAIHVHDNPEHVDLVKNIFKNKKQTTKTETIQADVIKDIEANAFNISFKEVLRFDNAYKSAFITYDKFKDEFDKTKLKVYFQDGQTLKNFVYTDLSIRKYITTDFNGGLKNIFIYKNNLFAFLTSLKGECYYASIIYLKDKNEIFKTKCLSGEIDFNGVGSTSIHYQDKILLSIGTPEWNNNLIANLAQDPNSFFGKIIEIKKKDLDKIISNEMTKINPTIFSSGHRNPQGLTILKKQIFSVEHGPKVEMN